MCIHRTSVYNYIGYKLHHHQPWNVILTFVIEGEKVPIQENIFHNSLTCTNLESNKILATCHIGLQSTWDESGKQAP